MQKYNIADFIGGYSKEFISPNTFISSLSKVKLILRTRANPSINQPKHYLVYKLPNEKRAYYFSALWSTSDTQGKEIWEYVVSDTQRIKAKCIITATSLKIEAL
jgi:hypothetical protein